MGSIMGKKAVTVEPPIVEDDEVATLDDEQQSTEAGEGEEAKATEQAAGEGEQQVDGQAAESDDDEVVVSIGEESPPQDEAAHAPEWVRELRKKNREDQRRIKELEDELKRAKAPAETKPAALGKKPTLDDFDYDTEKFEQELAAWYDRKRAADEAERKAREKEQEAEQAWKKKLDDYGKAKAELKVKDFDDAELAMQDQFNVTQQGIIVQGADNPALVVYALGKNPKKAKELASITDPVKFAIAVGKLETQLKVTNRKAPPPPEKTLQGTGPKSGAVDSTLERLRADAEKTGDYTKVLQYKRQKREATKS